MTDFNMRNILKNFNSVGKKKINESAIAECGMGPSTAPKTPMSVNISGDAGDISNMLRMLSGMESKVGGMPTTIVASSMDDPSIPGRDDIEGDDDMHNAIEKDESMEEFVNEPDEEYADHKFMTKDLSGGINREKNMYKPAAKGDNPMAVENIKDRLYKALNEKNAKPDFLDMDKDGDKKEPMKKAVADKKKAPVKEVSSKTRQSYTKAANASLDKALDSGDKKTVKKRDSGLDLAYDKKIRDMKKDSEARSKANEAAKPDFLDMDKDGNKKEPMKKAVADKKKKGPVKEGITNWKGEEVDPQVGDMVELYASYDDGTPIKGKIVGPGKKGEGSFAIKFKNLNGKVVTGSFYANDEFEITKKATKEAEVQSPSHEISDVARKAASIAQIIKRKINSGEQMDDRDYNQMAELGAILSRFGTSFGPKSMKDIMAHMVQYTNDRNEEGHGYPEFNVDRFKELMAMAKSKGESMMGEISSDLAKRYTKAAKMDRDFNDDDIARLAKSGQSTRDMHRKNSLRTKGINRAAKRIDR